MYFQASVIIQSETCLHFKYKFPKFLISQVEINTLQSMLDGIAIVSRLLDTVLETCRQFSVLLLSLLTVGENHQQKARALLNLYILLHCSGTLLRDT